MATSYGKALVQAHDFLAAPLSLARIASRSEALNAGLSRSDTLHMRLMITAAIGGLMYLGELFFMGSHSPEGWLRTVLCCFPGVMVCSSFLVAFLPTFWNQRLADMSFIGEDDEAKMQWLLERVPSARQLAEAVKAEPRRYLQGEFNAVHAAYQATRAATSQPGVATILDQSR
jgi:hypothetical protein